MDRVLHCRIIIELVILIAENRCMTPHFRVACARMYSCVCTKVQRSATETARIAHLSAKLNTNEFSEDSLARDSSSAQREIAVKVSNHRRFPFMQFKEIKLPARNSVK
jgi:hypothetical protein